MVIAVPAILMMSSDVERIVRRYYQLVDSGQVGPLVQLFSPDALYHRPGYEPLRGHSDLTKFYSSERVIDSGEHHLEAVLTSGDRAAVQGNFRGVLKDQTEVDVRFADFFIIRDNRILTRTTYFFAPLV